MLKLYDAFSKRVRKRAVEQKLIAFKISKEHANGEFPPALPDDTVLAAQGGAFSLFKVNEEDEELNWGQFKESLRGSMGEDAEPTITSIQRSAVSAISQAKVRDDDQIVRAPDNMIYRLIVTKQLEYYDGSKLVHMYFIPGLSLAILENSRSAVTLRLINVAAKYRDLFLNPGSSLSLIEFHRDPPFDDFRQRVQEVVRQLYLIEDQSHVLGLDQARSIDIYFGSDKSDLEQISRLSRDWYAARKTLIDAARAVISCKSAAGSESELRTAWLEALSAFIDTSNNVNSVTLRKAIANLQRYLFRDRDYIAEPEPILAPVTAEAPAIAPPAHASITNGGGAGGELRQ
jgi:hypothetical protein